MRYLLFPARLPKCAPPSSKNSVRSRSHKIGELPDPTPREGEVLVTIKATAVNFVDSLVVTGKYQFLRNGLSLPASFQPASSPHLVKALVG